MSRILRRPMFRGGRVDARGTGIASGLGYAGGGSVNTPKRGLVDGPGGYEGWKPPVDPLYKQKVKRTKNWLTPDVLEKKFRKEYYLDDEVEYTPDPASIGMQGMISDTYGLGMEGNPVIEEGGLLDIRRNQINEGPRNYEYIKNEWIKKNYKEQVEEQKKLAKQAGDLEKLEALGIDTSNIDAEIELTPAQLDNIELRKLLAARQSKGTPEEEIEKNKKIFAKAYGSGVADDASSMLLNFAGKALKPEATVKSAFGEFFEAEGKRPSERKKYKDAATTAAINAYLTGQKDYDSMMKQMKMIEHGVDYKTGKALEVKKSWNLNDYVMNKGTGVSTSQALADGARDKIKLNSEYTGFKKIKSKENTDDLLTDEYVGIIFMDEGTREVFAVIEEDGTVGKRVLYQ